MKQNGHHSEEIIPGRQETDQTKQVMYKFYKKPMAATLTMLARSALPENCKVSTASSKIQRRLKRSSLHLSGAEVEETLAKYMDDLAAMGFGSSWRRSVLESSMRGYRRLLWRVEQGTTRRNRLGAETSTARRVDKLVGKSTWFKKQKREEQEQETGARRPRSRNKETEKPLDPN